MGVEDAGAILVIGAIYVLYTIIKDFKDTEWYMSFIKNLGYLFLMFMALSALNLGVALYDNDAGVSTDEQLAIQIIYRPYFWASVTFFVLFFVWVLFKAGFVAIDWIRNLKFGRRKR